MVSIIIVTWHVRKILQKCLQSIYNLEKSVPFEIIIVDNNSQDGTDSMIKEEFLKVKYIKLNKNHGFAKACNLGAKESKGKYLLFLNPDTQWHQEILPQVLNFYNNTDKIGVLGVKLLNSNKTTQYSVRALPTLYSQLIILSKLHIIFKELISKYLCLNFNYNQNQKVEQVSGAFFMINRNIYDQIGGFDENFFIWFEEVDFCQQVKKIGFHNYYFSEVSIIHHGEESFKQINNLKKQIIFNKSLSYYFKKNKSQIEYLIILLFIPLNSLITILIKFFQIKPKHYL